MMFDYRRISETYTRRGSNKKQIVTRGWLNLEHVVSAYEEDECLIVAMVNGEDITLNNLVGEIGDVARFHEAMEGMKK